MIKKVQQRQPVLQLVTCRKCGSPDILLESPAAITSRHGTDGRCRHCQTKWTVKLVRGPATLALEFLEIEPVWPDLDGLQNPPSRDDW